jgi:CheY-like chemotaxis protein
MATKLLLADDSATIHKVVGLTFAAEDLVVDAVADGNLALQKVRTDRPDIVLADVFMPGRNGYELCAAIKSDPDLALTPVVLLVGTFEAFDEEEASRVQCDAYLTKPFDTSELIQIVRRLVERHKSAQTERLTTEPQICAAGDDHEGAESCVVSERTRESFLGPTRILELFDASELKPDPASRPAAANTGRKQASTGGPVIPFPVPSENFKREEVAINLTEEMIDRIVEKAVRRMSQEVVREIAWEVVPAVSEVMIRQYLQELRVPKK